jgi:NitT/TauT family transport system permease protein
MSLLLFFLLWELASRLGLINRIFFPPVSRILITIWSMLSEGLLWPHIRISLTRAMVGFILAVSIGVPLGLLLGGWYRRLSLSLDLTLEVFSQLNPFLLYHILILFLGIDEAPKITIIFWTCLWPIMFCTINGVREVNPILLKAGRAFGLSRIRLLINIALPAAGPTIFSGLRLSLGYSMFMLIAAEMMGASAGLGWLVLTSQETFQLNKMYAGVVVIAITGLALDILLNRIGQKLLGSVKEEMINSVY